MNNQNSLPVYYKDDDKVIYLGTIQKIRLGTFKRQIRFNQDSTLLINLKYLLFKHGWIVLPNNIKDIDQYLNTINLTNDILNLIYTSLLNSKISTVFLSELFQLQLNTPKLFDNLYNKMIAISKPFNLENYLIKELNDILGHNYSTCIREFINIIWGIKIANGGNNIGKGEICLTLLTGASKAKVGDLQVNNYKIELKCNGGKVGSQFYADLAPKRLANILNIDYEFFQDSVLMHKIFRKNNVEIIKLNNSINIRKEHLLDKIYKVDIKNEQEYQSRLLNGKLSTKNQLILKHNISQVRKYIKSEINEIPVCTETGITQKELNTLKNEKELLKENSIINISKTKLVKFGFQHAVKSFFIDYYNNLSNIQLINGFFECRNTRLSNKQQMLLLDAIYEFFNSHPLSYLNNETKLGKLILTLHIFCYWITHDFTNIQFINDKTKDTFILQLPLKSSTFIKEFEYIYNSIPKQITTNLSLGGQNPVGVEVYLEI